MLAAGLAASLTLALLTGCRTEDRTAGRYLDDRMTARRVQSNLQHNPVYKYPDVKVAVFAGVVQLSGFADASQQITTAGDLAARAEGARQVINGIALKPQDNFTPTGSLTGRRYQSNTSSGTSVTPNANTNPVNPDNTGTTGNTGNNTRNVNPNNNSNSSNP